MCGLIGYVLPQKPSGGEKGPTINELRSLISLGLFADTVRGHCGTGIYAYDFDKKTQHEFKKALAGPDFLQHRVFQRFSDSLYKYRLVIGHNRASTVGSAVDENCHPFISKHIGLAHNGTVNNHLQLSARDFRHDVDSAHITNGFAEFGEKPTLEKMRGPAVLVWHNNENNTFNIARNNNRDIWYICLKGGGIAFASEYLMLDWVLWRAGIETVGKYQCPGDHTWLSWDLSKERLNKPHAVSFELKEEPRRNFKNNTGWGHSDLYDSQTRDDKDLAPYGLVTYQRIKAKVVGFGPYNREWEEKELSLIPDYINGYLELRALDNDKAKDLPIKVHQSSAKAAKELLNKEGTASIRSCWFQGNDLMVIAQNFSLAGAGEKKEADVRRLPGVSYKGPDGKFVSKAEAERLLLGGCCWCADPIPLEDINNVVWINWLGELRDEPICPACANNPEVRTTLELDEKRG